MKAEIINNQNRALEALREYKKSILEEFLSLAESLSKEMEVLCDTGIDTDLHLCFENVEVEGISVDSEVGNQPVNEEIFEGADNMIRAGVLDDPHVDAGMMIHVTAGMPFPAGTSLIMSPGISASACDFFEIQIQGKGCHGSAPEQGVDPITVAAHIVLALQELNAREISMYDNAALTFGVIQAGTVNNVIPDIAVLKGSLRTVDEDVRARLKIRMQEIVRGMGALYRAEASIDFGSGCPSLLNDKEVSDCVPKYAKELFTQRGAFTTAELAAMSGGGSKGAGGSEDFAYVSRQIPVVMVALAAGQPQAGYTFPGHHPKVRFDESAMVNGSALFAYCAMRYLEEHS